VLCAVGSRPLRPVGPESLREAAALLLCYSAQLHVQFLLLLLSCCASLLVTGGCRPISWPQNAILSGSTMLPCC
jgi:hypothetical protein